MRIISLMTHSTTLFVLQLTIIVWFSTDFFLARDSATSNKLFNDHLARSEQASLAIKNIETLAGELKSNLSCDKQLVESPTFDKLIFMVIDALGSEFIATLSQGNQNNGKHPPPFKMPFLEQSLIDHKTQGYVAKAATPTVTMPRIKALVSGSVPSFTDVIYNVINDKPHYNEDNFLSLAASRGRSLVFYGDDTWLSLFNKSMFKRSRETLSLYASDYTSVDANVTEMALPETMKDHIDWDLMILHYLGLDHLGHVFGTNESPSIDRKLLEMDSVIEQIHHNMAKKDHKTLLLITGDHGMSREGNHGGGSPLESNTAMLFMPINRQFKKVNQGDVAQIAQIDLAITLTLLTGLPVPATSRGVLIEPLIRSLWGEDVDRITCASILNVEQLTALLEDSQFVSDGLGAQVGQLLRQKAKLISKEDKESFFKESLGLARSMQEHLVRVVASRSNNLLLVVIVVLVMALSMLNMRRACNRLLLPLMSSRERVLNLGSLLVPILMLNSTDFIEMEQVFWPIYLLIVLTLFCLMSLGTHSPKKIMADIEVDRAVLFSITFLISVAWNHVDFLGHREWGRSLPIVSVLILCNFTRQMSNMRGKQSIAPFAVGSLLLITKFIEEESERHQDVASLQIITLVSVVMASIAFIYVSYGNGDTQPTGIVQKLATCWMWWVFLLVRSRNYVFLASNLVMEASLNSLANAFQFNSMTRAIIYLVCASNAFYGQGNTNLFTSLDIKPAFYGQTQYSLVSAMILVACATFGTQIYWYIKLFQRVQGEKEQERMSLRPKLIGQSDTSDLIPEGTKDAIKDFVDMRNFLTIAYYLLVCMVLRDHLFVWSVLSPKLVYLFMTTISVRIATATISKAPDLIIKVLEPKENSTNVRYKKVVE